jgi:predicted TIM-barrel fold metal-dependent hydrolase
MIPVTGVKDAIKEMEYCKNAGLKGVALVTFPNGQTYPTPEDDLFWQAALDLPMPIAVHVKFLGPEGQIFKYPKKPAHIGQGDDPLRMFLRPPGDCCKHFVQLMFAGVFDRFPNLRLYSAETLVGWMPCALERIDDNYNRTRYWMEREFGLGPLAKMPSEYILNHGKWGFLLDKFGVKMRHEYGVQNAMWGSDFPHGQGDWPESHRILDEMFAAVPEDERYAMVAGNAVSYFGLDNEA